MPTASPRGEVAVAELQAGVVGLRAQLGAADVLQQDDARPGPGRGRRNRSYRRAGCVRLEDDVFELVRVGQAADDAHCHLVGLVGIGGRKAKLSGGDFDVLLRQRVGDIQRGQPARRQLVGIEPDAHGVLALAEDDDRAHARNTLQRIRYIDVKVVGDEGRRERVVGRDEAAPPARSWSSPW